MHLVGYFYETYHDARSPEHSAHKTNLYCRHSIGLYIFGKKNVEIAAGMKNKNP